MPNSTPTTQARTWAEINNGRPWGEIHTDKASWEEVHPGGAAAYAAQQAASAPQEG